MPWQPDTAVTWGITNGHAVTGTSFPPGLLIPAVTYRSSFGYVVVRQSAGDFGGESEMSLRFQMKMDLRSKLEETLSNMLRLISETQDQITANLK